MAETLTPSQQFSQSLDTITAHWQDRVDAAFVRYEKSLTAESARVTRTVSAMAARATQAIEETGHASKPVLLEGWRRFGNCVGEDSAKFFLNRGTGATEAKALCATCPVQRECLEFALVNSEKFGIWGGKSSCERRRIRSWRMVVWLTQAQTGGGYFPSNLN